MYIWMDRHGNTGYGTTYASLKEVEESLRDTDTYEPEDGEELKVFQYVGSFHVRETRKLDLQFNAAHDPLQEAFNG